MSTAAHVAAAAVATVPRKTPASPLEKAVISGATFKGLKSVGTEKDAAALLKHISTLTFPNPLKDGKREEIAWATLTASTGSGQCINRSRLIATALGLGAKGLKEFPADLSKADLIKLATKPEAQGVPIKISGRMRITSAYSDSARKLELPQNFLADWTYHQATLIKVGGEPRVVDLAVSDKPLTIDAWTRCFFPEGVTPKPVSPDAFHKSVDLGQSNPPPQLTVLPAMFEKDDAKKTIGTPPRLTGQSDYSRALWGMGESNRELTNALTKKGLDARRYVDEFGDFRAKVITAA
ncbi:MAG: hypothetical protein K1X89_08515 [Myxococcaceae bacterium]|nr:hypothetical protein [Myxococcaceae bacterium]